MTPERWVQIKEVFTNAAERVGEARAAYVEEACGADEELRREVESLLRERPHNPTFESPIRKPDLSGRSISHYRVLEKLGEGGMGVVYKAQDTSLDRTVALKFLAPHLLESEEHKQRFLREAKATASLDHPNICMVHEVGEADGRTFIAMAFVEGPSLADKIKERPLPLQEALDIALQIAAGLQEAHEKGVVHRDIKPQNIMLTAKGQVKIMDFGLAYLTGRSKLTKSGTTMGTPVYMSPEQALGQPVDRRSDIWSMGVVLYEMVTGHLPFEGEREQAVVYSIVNEPHEPITAVRVGVPTELDRIIGKVLSKNPAERYQNVEDMLVDLQALRKSPLRVFGAAAAAQSRRRRLLWAGPGVLAALLALALGLNMSGIRDRILGGPAAPSIASIAVLPLQNLSGDPEQEYFVDGMTEALIADLAKIGALKVMSRTSVMRYKRTDKPLREIAAELGVDAVLEGSAQRVGDNVRITAKLIDAATDKHLWAETYTRAVTDVLGLQSEVARAIAGAIRVTVAPQEQAQLAVGRRVDPGVYELVLRGQYYANRGAEEDLTKAIEYFEQAIARDPNHAPAHAGLAFSYQNLASIYRPPREVMPKAKAAALRALELDETLADAHVTLARVLLFYDWDWPATEKHLKRAAELSPNSAAVHILYSNYYTALGRPQEALAEIRFAWALDPLSLAVHRQLVFGLIAARQYDEGIAQAHQALEREPNFAFAHAAAAVAYVEKGEFGRAIEEMEKANELESNTTITALTAHVQAAAGNRRHAEKLLEGLKAGSPRRYVCAYEMAHAYVKLGHKKQAFEWLEKGKQERADCMVWLLTEPWMDPLRGERQYRELLDHIGLATGKAGPKP